MLLISPQNRILLLHRVQTSSSFASAHVFPGGHLSAQDGSLPPPSDPARHEDSPAYRLAAIRECFEESGILLARAQSNVSSLEKTGVQLIEVSEEERDEARKRVHAEEVGFVEWVKDKGGEPDIDGLVPFTRWLTPANIPRRFSTQMYLYFLPLRTAAGSSKQETTTRMHVPTPDGGIEHTAAEFKYAQEWIEQSLRREIVLFPPQFFLLSLVADFLKPPDPPGSDIAGLVSVDRLREQRESLLGFVKEDGDPPWTEKCISPDPIKREDKAKFLIMGMANAGPELAGTGRKGDAERVLRVEADKEIERGRRRPHPVEVIWRASLSDRNGSGKL